jgi:hypothetical protein
MPDERKESGLIEQKVQRVQRVANVVNPNRATVYANSAVVTTNQWDIQVYFGCLQETGPGKVEVVDQAAVIMNPEHALAFSRALQQVLQAYERASGKIREIKPLELPTASAAPAAQPARPAVRDERK